MNNILEKTTCARQLLAIRWRRTGIWSEKQFVARIDNYISS
jgi:hypothetical protein